jgi:hypothetical protein
MALTAKPDKIPRKRQARRFTDHVEISLSEDMTLLTIHFGGEADPTVSMPTDQVDRMIKNLSAWRSQMIPQHPTTFALGQTVQAQVDPTWVTEPEKSGASSRFHVRHPGFGWLSFLIPKKGSG